MSNKNSTGNYSTGDWSTGDYSTGDGSTGDWSTGDWSTGDWSTGDFSTGDFSTGDGSTGNLSTGDYSTGDLSTGDWSTGDYSTGDWSTGHYSTGHFCTIDGAGFGAFNKPLAETYQESVEIWRSAIKPSCLFFSLTEWVDPADMTDVEKANNPTYETTGGYLKVYEFKQAFSESVLSASKEERDMIRSLPNFDADVFLEISGVDIRLLDR